MDARGRGIVIWRRLSGPLGGHVLRPALALLTGLLGCASPRGATAPGFPQALEDSTSRSLVARGLDLVQAGDDAGALAAFGEALTGTLSLEDRVKALRWRGHVYLRRSEPESALADFVAAREGAPEDAWLCYAEGRAWSVMGEFERAEACYGAAIERDAGHIKALQWRAETRRYRNDDEGALEDLTRALTVLDEASDEELAAWGGERHALLSMTLALRIETLAALGDHVRAAEDRARRGRLLDSD